MRKYTVRTSDAEPSQSREDLFLFTEDGTPVDIEAMVHDQLDGAGALIDVTSKKYGVSGEGDWHEEINQALVDAAVDKKSVIVPGGVTVDGPLVTKDHTHLYLGGRIAARPSWAGGPLDGVVNLSAPYSRVMHGFIDAADVAAAGVKHDSVTTRAWGVEVENYLKAGFFHTNNNSTGFDAAAGQTDFGCHTQGSNNDDANGFVIENSKSGNSLTDIKIVGGGNYADDVHALTIAQNIFGTAFGLTGGGAADFLGVHFVGNLNMDGETILGLLTDVSFGFCWFDSGGITVPLFRATTGSTRYMLEGCKFIRGANAALLASPKPAFQHDGFAGGIQVLGCKVLGRGDWSFEQAFYFPDAAPTNSVLKDNTGYGCRLGISNRQSTGSFERKGNKMRGIQGGGDDRDKGSIRRATLRTGAAAAWAMPVGTNPIPANIGYEIEQDLTGVEDVRIYARIPVVFPAPAGVPAKLQAQYTTDLTGATGWTNLTGTVDVNALGNRMSAWSALPAAANGEVLIRVVGIGGDGATSGQIATLAVDGR